VDRAEHPSDGAEKDLAANDTKTVSHEIVAMDDDLTPLID